jgi:glycosyltransferase involved in cell wall biosynthesis
LKRILFISHEATRTGAPLILLHLIKWLKINTKDVQFDVLLLNEGSIAEDFKKECNNIFVYSKAKKQLKFQEILKEKISAKFGIKNEDHETLILNEIYSNNYDLVYANTVSSIKLGAKIKYNSQKAKLLVHVHELQTIIKIQVPDFGNYIKDVDQYIAVSQLVSDNLVYNYGIDKDKVDLVYEFGIIHENILKKTNQVFTVGGAGTTHWRKGDDIFILVANHIAKRYPELKINFVWVGDTSHNATIIEEDLKKLNLTHMVTFVGTQPDPLQFYKDFDVFLLTSREDPFPLVCIETASLSKPIICFEKASGTTEVVSQGGGFIVPYLDIQAMAEKIILYYEDENKRITDGKKANELFDAFTLDKIGSQLCERIMAQLN